VQTKFVCTAINRFPFVFDYSAAAWAFLCGMEIHSSPHRELCRLPACDFVCERNLVARIGTQVRVRLKVTEHFGLTGGSRERSPRRLPLALGEREVVTLSI